jgi:hypothetical protein
MKLLKDHKEYILIDELRNLIATTDKTILKTSPEKYKLCRDNCNEIFGFVDVDYLATEHAWCFSNCKGVAKHNIAKESFIDGFNACRDVEGYEFKDSDMIEFATWINKLTPAQKVSVWSKNGEYKGLFTMDEEQLFDKWLNEKSEIRVKYELDLDAPCPKCGESENLHGNYDYAQKDGPFIETLCNECGNVYATPLLDDKSCIKLIKL